MPEMVVHILTGPVQSGKTSSLLQWAEKRNDVYGILTPVVNGKRVFMNAHTKEQFPMQAGSEETDLLSIGRFVFSKAGFEKAIQVISASVHCPGWLVIDEVGPLELRGEGFYNVIKEVLINRTSNLLLVVREGLADAVITKFLINGSIVITDTSAIHS
jgi:nucleoside-triphosphatase THEP1